MSEGVALTYQAHEFSLIFLTWSSMSEKRSVPFFPSADPSVLVMRRSPMLSESTFLNSVCWCSMIVGLMLSNSSSRNGVSLCFRMRGLS